MKAHVSSSFSQIHVYTIQTLKYKYSKTQPQLLNIFHMEEILHMLGLALKSSIYHMETMAADAQVYQIQTQVLPKHRLERKLH